MKALITGATGFIGSHLAERLLKLGYDVSCLVRNTSGIRWLEDLDIHLIRGDLTDKDLLVHSVKGVDYIFHIAGVTKTIQREEFYFSNSRITEMLIETVVENNPDVRRFIYMSSLSAFGPWTDCAIPTENETPHPVSDYGKSKLLGEQAVLRYSDKVAVTILRPCAVYGPRDKEFFLIFKLVNNRLLPYWGEGRLSLIYIEDLIESIVLASNEEKAIGKTYFISDGMVYSNSAVIDEIASSLGVRVNRIMVPRFLLLPIGFFSEIISKIMRNQSMINSDKMKEIRHSHWVCDISRAKKDLKFTPRIGLKKGIKWTADWYRIHKWM